MVRDFRLRCAFLLTLLASIVAGAAGSSQAAIMVTTQTTAGNTLPTTPSVSTDLLQTSLGSVFPIGGDSLLTGPAKYNGTTGTAHENTGANPANVNATGTYDFFLDTTTNTLGYDISEINTYTGWIDFRAGQDHRIFYSLVGDAAFVQIADVLSGHSNGTQRTSVTDTAGLIASGVDAIRFIVDQSQFVYREVDVVGTATLPPPSVPEPATILIAALGIAAMGYSAWRCRRKNG